MMMTIRGGVVKLLLFFVRSLLLVYHRHCGEAVACTKRRCWIVAIVAAVVGVVDNIIAMIAVCYKRMAAVLLLLLQ